MSDAEKSILSWLQDAFKVSKKARQVKCPKCGAKPGFLCVAHGGGYSSVTHVERVKKALRK